MTLTGSYLEAKIKALVDQIGGSAYSSGSAYSTPGALVLGNLSSATRITNDLKLEPYSLFSVQLRCAAPRPSPPLPQRETVWQVSPEIASAAAGASVVAAYFSYAALTGGTAATFLVSASSNVTLFYATITGLAPLTVYPLTVAANSLAGVSLVTGTMIVSAVTGGGGLGMESAIDPTITLVCKSKHVA